MAKNIRRMLATVLVMCMFVSALPMQALAAEDDPTITATETITGGEVTITFTPTGENTSDVDISGTNESGSEVKLEGTSTTTSSTETKPNGTVVETDTTKVELKGTEDNGEIEKEVEYQNTTTDITITEKNGTITEQTFIDGSETKEWAVEEDDKGDPSVNVELKPGETTTGVAKVEGTETSETTTKDGTVITETTYEADRTVTATTSDVEITENETESGLTDSKSLAPVYDKINGVKEDKGGMFDSQFNSGATSKYANPSNWDMPEGADVRYVGTGEHSKYYVATGYVVYEKDADGNTIYDENGKPVIKEVRRYSDEDSAIITIDGQPVTELPEGITLEPVYDNYGGSRPFLFMLMDKNKNKFYGYCCDLETDAGDGNYYTISNLEDSDYYASEESEQHIRSILMNGYWGTSDIPKEDGSYELGSMESIKNGLREAINSGKMENSVIQTPKKDSNGNPVLDEDGNPVMESKTMLEIIEGLTSGEALLATQAAVWTYANGSNNVLNGKDGAIVLDPDGYKWNQDPNTGSKKGEAMDDYGSARVDFLYTWLITQQDETESTVVINDKNFVEDMNLTVHDKVEDHAQNQDDDQDNDVYNTELNFTLAFVPDKESDDLLVYLYKYNENGEAEVMTDAEGKPVVRRLAGNNSEGQSYDAIEADENGVYTLTGLQLGENKDINFDLRLEGTQYLEQGVYIYEAVGGRKASQNFVGVAEGNRSVDISAGITIRFDVDENNKVVAEREWHYESDPDITPPADPEEPVPYNDEGEIPEPIIFRMNNEGLQEIPEEPVPLAAPVSTGDNSGMWIAVVILAVFGIVAINLFDKKRQHEAF